MLRFGIFKRGAGFQIAPALAKLFSSQDIHQIRTWIVQQMIVDDHCYIGWQTFNCNWYGIAYPIRVRWFTFSRKPEPRVLDTSTRAPIIRSVKTAWFLSAFICVYLRLMLALWLAEKSQRRISRR